MTPSLIRLYGMFQLLGLRSIRGLTSPRRASGNWVGGIVRSVSILTDHFATPTSGPRSLQDFHVDCRSSWRSGIWPAVNRDHGVFGASEPHNRAGRNSVVISVRPLLDWRDN